MISTFTLQHCLPDITAEAKNGPRIYRAGVGPFGRSCGILYILAQLCVNYELGLAVYSQFQVVLGITCGQLFIYDQNNLF